MTDDPNSTRHRGAAEPRFAEPERPQPVVGGPVVPGDGSNGVSDAGSDGVESAVSDGGKDPGATRYRGPLATPNPAIVEPPVDAGSDGRTASAARSTETVALPDRHLHVPVYRPRGRGRLVAAACGIGLVVVGGVIGYLVHRPPAAQAKTQVSEAIAQIHVRVLSGDLHCPSGVLRAQATLTVTGGSGDVRYEWLLPTGESTAPQSVGVSPGATTTVTLDYTLSGQGDANGVVSLHVTDPVDVYSNPVPVKYSCP